MFLCFLLQYTPTPAPPCHLNKLLMNQYLTWTALVFILFLIMHSALSATVSFWFSGFTPKIKRVSERDLERQKRLIISIFKKYTKNANIIILISPPLPNSMYHFYSEWQELFLSMYSCKTHHNEMSFYYIIMNAPEKQLSRWVFPNIMLKH